MEMMSNDSGDGSPPHHIGIIMDGNGRWAQARGLPRVAGHQAGVQTIRRMVEACHEIGIHALTLYAFSTENWKRPKAEVAFLMQLLEGYVANELPGLQRKGPSSGVLQSCGRIFSENTCKRRFGFTGSKHVGTSIKSRNRD